MMSVWDKHRRWSDNDHHFGPFLYSRSESYKAMAITLQSGDDEYAGCSLRVSVAHWTLIVALPNIIRPWRRKVQSKYFTEEMKDRLGRDWYWDVYPREYGFSFSSSGQIGSSGYDFLHVFYGRQTHDSTTDQNWCWSLPWKKWRHVRHSLYGLDGEMVVEDVPDWHDHEVRQAALDSCSVAEFSFADYDSEVLTAKTRIEEREWRRGDGWFKWLSWFYAPTIRRSLNIEFSGETGEEKGSWKGGTMGTSLEMHAGELHEAAFKRYCEMHVMTLNGSVEDGQG